MKDIQLKSASDIVRNAQQSCIYYQENTPQPPLTRGVARKSVLSPLLQEGVRGCFIMTLGRKNIFIII